MPWTKRGKLIALAEIDLAPIRRLMTLKMGWEAPRALAAERGYKRFLALMILHPGVAMVPDAEIDAFWHMHILDTRRYLSDCLHVFGRIIHHDPHLAHGSVQLAVAWQRTRELYRLHYPQVAGAGDESAHHPLAATWPGRPYGRCFAL